MEAPAEYVPYDTACNQAVSRTQTEARAYFEAVIAPEAQHTQRGEASQRILVCSVAGSSMQ